RLGGDWKSVEIGADHAPLQEIELTERLDGLDLGGAQRGDRPRLEEEDAPAGDRELDVLRAAEMRLQQDAHAAELYDLRVVEHRMAMAQELCVNDGDRSAGQLSVGLSVQAIGVTSPLP